MSARLESLLDGGDLDGLLSVVSLDDVADAWLCYTARSRRSEAMEWPDADWRAIEFWLTASPIWDAEDLVQRGLLALVAHVSDDLLLEYVGAGPVESYEGRTPEANEWLEAQADGSARFRLALSRTYRYRESGI